MTYDELIAFTVAQGCDEAQVRAGSMPEEACATVINHLPIASCGIYVGAFVGVGLAAVCRLGEHCPRTVLAIDPGISHRGIDRPTDVAQALWESCRLGSVINLVQAYSIGYTPPNDGLDYAGPVTPAVRGFWALQNLIRAGVRADWILLDGGHGTVNVLDEVLMAHQLLSPSGLLFMDDVDPNWIGIQAMWNILPRHGFEHIAHEGRVGVARKV